MPNQPNTTTPERRTLLIAPKPTWKCYMYGLDTYILRVEKPPFILWRWMQRILIGSKWEKL